MDLSQSFVFAEATRWNLTEANEEYKEVNTGVALIHAVPWETSMNTTVAPIEGTYRVPVTAPTTEAIAEGLLASRQSFR